MISPDTLLYIYEIRGDHDAGLLNPPPSYIGLWNEEEFSYLFFTSPEDEYVFDRICSGASSGVTRHEMKYRDWQTGLPSHGFTIGGISFVPTDHPNPPHGALLLDPSVVFGDGTHPTTLSCLKLMEDIIPTRGIASMLDLGTGTGILALAGAAMGLERILAVDKNRLAVETAQENVATNSLSSTISVTLGEVRLFLDEPADLVCANLPFQVLREIVPRRETALHDSWIVSGINHEQGTVIKNLFADQNFRCERQLDDQIWVTFVVVNEVKLR
jgi:ribosomal protein L11 methyltransferase